MSFKELNRVCTCGHTREHHSARSYQCEDHSICWACESPGKTRSTAYHQFKLDNLNYLLEKYETRHR